MEPNQLVAAYQNGFFPMPDPDTGEILWIRPRNRALIPLDGFHTSRSLFRKMKKDRWKIRINQDFRRIMEACRSRPDSWITDDFVFSYGRMHDLGLAHSIEVYWDDKLAGGTYGVSLGGVFFAESKFHWVTDASKIALYALIKHMRQCGMVLLEVQFLTPHLASLGAVEVPHKDYLLRLQEALSMDVQFGNTALGEIVVP